MVDSTANNERQIERLRDQRRVMIMLEIVKWFVLKILLPSITSLLTLLYNIL